MTPRLLFEPEAEAEFLEARRWYAERSSVIAEAFRTAVAQTLEVVESAPHSFPIAVLDIQKALVRRFPYVVYYVSLPQVTTVIAVIHARRDPRVWQERRR